MMIILKSTVFEKKFKGIQTFFIFFSLWLIRTKSIPEKNKQTNKKPNKEC